MSGLYSIGSIVFDCVARPVEELPARGAASNVESIQLRLGGNGAGAAAAAARLGVPSRLAGAVGVDAAGRQALLWLRGAGVNVGWVRILPEQRTAATVVLVEPDGERRFLQDLAATAALSPDDVPFPPELASECSWFHFGSPYCLARLRPYGRQILSSARAVGLRTSLDVDWDQQGEWIDVLEPLCPLLDVLFLNEVEAEKLTGSTAPGDVADFFQVRGVKTVVLKSGAAGCHVLDGRERFSIPALPVAARDSTGAGDCFCGAMLAGLIRGLDLEQAAELANAAAAAVVHAGCASDGVPTFEEARAQALAFSGSRESRRQPMRSLAASSQRTG